MKAAIHQLQYWPGLRFFSKMRSADVFVYLDDVQFEKREFQNRNRIRVADGWRYLTAPVLSKGRFSQKILSAELDGSRRWRESHLLAIRTSYGRARFFRDYLPALESIYSARYRFLGELAEATISFLRAALGITTPVRRSSEFSLSSVSTRRLVDLCGAVGADEYLSGAGARGYLDAAMFRNAGIKLAWQDFKVVPYGQAFPGFEPDMSALDLLMNRGPDSAGYL